ncbi:MAG TPA: hypothetical protein VGU21_08170, partial [Streptosporangiaceae bacterium]|nr:hypothetical protein [Streptosporangiaceae bacterium]
VGGRLADSRPAGSGKSTTLHCLAALAGVAAIAPRRRGYSAPTSSAPSPPGNSWSTSPPSPSARAQVGEPGSVSPLIHQRIMMRYAWE